jgi:hypothetical protein
MGVNIKIFSFTPQPPPPPSSTTHQPTFADIENYKSLHADLGYVHVGEWAIHQTTDTYGDHRVDTLTFIDCVSTID